MDAEGTEEQSKAGKTSNSRKKANEHVEQLRRLQEKDPEFYQFLKEHDTELLEFNDEDIDEDAETGMAEIETEDDNEIQSQEVEHLSVTEEKGTKSSKKAITTGMVDYWCDSIREDPKKGALRAIMKAFSTACHYGDDGKDESSEKLSIMSSSVFNKIMLFVLSEIDGVFRGLLKLPPSGGKQETMKVMMRTKQWKRYSHLVKSYLGNTYHILNQMTDSEMISFTLRRIRFSSVFLVGFPGLLRKYIKVALHFWGTGGGALPIVSFLFIRDLCVRLGSDCLEECVKGMYKAFVLNCQFVNAVKLQHIQFLGNCVIELLGVDLSTAYQHAFAFIRQLTMILREALTMKTKEAFRKVYEWKYINCLELWTGAICAYSSEADFKPLAYPLTQIISGVARLVPTAQYVPLRLRCARMLDRISASTGTYIPVSLLLLDMLEMKELNRPPTGGPGKAVDLRTILKVSKTTLKTRAFQEACIHSVVEELAEHLSQWSCSVAFFELSFIPLVRLRGFCKTTKIERFRKEMKWLIRQIEANSEFVNEKRKSISFLPNGTAVASFLEDEKKSGGSPLSQYATTLRQRAQQRNDSLVEASVVVGENSFVFGKKLPENDEEDDARNDEGAAVFSSSWLPGSDSKEKKLKVEKKRGKKRLEEQQARVAYDEDIVEDLILSSDEDDEGRDTPSTGKDVKGKALPRKQQLGQKRKKSKKGLKAN